MRTSGWNRSGFFFTTEIKRFVLDGSERTDSGLTTFFFSERNVFHFLGGSVGSGNGTRQNIPACVHKQQNICTATNLRVVFQASTHIVDLEFKIFDREKLTFRRLTSTIIDVPHR